MAEIKLGVLVRDKITGFEGIVVACTKWLTGCTTYGVRSRNLKDGQPMSDQWFDETVLEVQEQVFDQPEMASVESPRGPMPIPQRQMGPGI